MYKLSLDAGFTCPNRDGSLGSGGCIFCSAGGSGDFAGNRSESITEQLARQKEALAHRREVHSYIAYFQAFTNTYAPVDVLETKYREAMMDPEVRILAIATRPDCLGPEVLDLLETLNREKKIWVELGLQTANESTARLIRRGYQNSVFEQAVRELYARGIEVIVHLILGLPGESEKDVLETIACINRLPVSGVKLQLLHVLKGTDLALLYERGQLEVLTLEQYLDLVISCLTHLREDIVIHRLTGDGPKNLLIEPAWSSKKRTVLNQLHHRLKEREAFQGQDVRG